MYDYYISYFYNIRFMTPNILPISTAIWDPKWFHNNNGNKYIYRDKNGVINGVRLNILNFNDYDATIDCPKGGYKNCTQADKVPNCSFMSKYYDFLRNTINFNEMIQHLEKNVHSFDITIDTIILLVYESKNCPCAERPVLRQWFSENGIDLPEWR